MGMYLSTQLLIIALAIVATIASLILKKGYSQLADLRKEASSEEELKSYTEQANSNLITQGWVIKLLWILLIVSAAYGAITHVTIAPTREGVYWEEALEQAAVARAYTEQKISAMYAEAEAKTKGKASVETATQAIKEANKSKKLAFLERAREATLADLKVETLPIK